ncbi:MAG: ABC transporter permease subunit [Anaerolineae bacterium]|nr:ABC transporter permease subunit [Anaerolineae bacterium]
MTVQTISQGASGKKRRGLQFSERHLPFALLVPAIVIILLVVGIPMLYSLYLSFTNYTLTSAQDYDFVGFQNYITLLFDDPLFWKAFGRTVLFISLAVNIEFLIGLGIAHLMARAIRGQSLGRTLMMMPMMFAPILVGFQFKWFFSAQVGLVNNILYTLTGEAQFIPWLVDTPLGFISILVAEIWMSTPFMVIILEAGILSLPQEPFEAAEVDGASGWQKFRHLTLPMLMPFIYTAMAIRSLDVARAYDVVSIMTGGGPGNRTELIWTYVNRLAFTGQQFALGSAMSYITVILSFVFTFMFFRNVLKSRWAGGMDE